MSTSKHAGKLRRILAALAIVAVAGGIAAAPAVAHDFDARYQRHDARDHERFEHARWEHERYEHRVAPSYAYVAPPVYAAPQPSISLGLTFNLQ